MSKLMGPVLAVTMVIGASSPADAAYIFNSTEVAMFDFSKGSNFNVQDGNLRFYSATSPDFGTVQVRVTGWSIERVRTGLFSYTNLVDDSKLMVYDGGLGIISGDDDGGSYNQHTADNEGRKDFFLLQFNAPVALIGATFDTYSVLGRTRDSDATIKYGWNYDTPWNQSLNLDGKAESYFNGMFDGSYESLGGSAGGHRMINPDLHWGNVRMIGASFANRDGKIDGFKLNDLAVVPEPSTWMMLISGFGLLGAALRRQRRSSRAITAA